MDDLLAHLGQSWTYDIASSGGSQRVAFIYDTEFVQTNAISEIEVSLVKIGGSDIFARDPLVGHFAFLHEGAPRNDLFVVGLHLASGQYRATNHDAAMDRLLGELEELREDGTVLPANEFDLMIGGDLNASMFDSKREDFFEELDEGTWDVLAEEPYPPTRLAGNPLEPRSQIDYLIASRVSGSQNGLVGEEISENVAKVHHELAGDDEEWVQFRQTFSDHMPVTACVGVKADGD